MKSTGKYLILIVTGILFVSCSSETRRYQLHLDDETNVTYSEVRENIEVSGNELKEDVHNRLSVLNVFIEDVMEKYRQQDDERKQLLEPKVNQLERQYNKVEFQIGEYEAGGEQQSEELKHKIRDNMQELRKTYHYLTVKLGMNWH